MSGNVTKTDLIRLARALGDAEVDESYSTRRIFERCLQRAKSLQKGDLYAPPEVVRIWARDVLATSEQLTQKTLEAEPTWDRAEQERRFVAIYVRRAAEGAGA